MDVKKAHAGRACRVRTAYRLGVDTALDTTHVDTGRRVATSVATSAVETCLQGGNWSGNQLLVTGTLGMNPCHFQAPNFVSITGD